MRPLTEEETKTFFEKLSKYIGENIKQLIDRSDGTYCFRLHRERVYYVSERIMKQVWHDHILYILRVLLNRSSFNYKIRTGLYVLVESTEFINFLCFIKKQLLTVEDQTKPCQRLFARYLLLSNQNSNCILTIFSRLQMLPMITCFLLERVLENSPKLKSFAYTSQLQIFWPHMPPTKFGSRQMLNNNFSMDTMCVNQASAELQKIQKNTKELWFIP